MEEKNTLVDPFVVNKKAPDQKMYLLLLTRLYDGEEEEEQSWHFILGRTFARQFIIDNIETIDPYKSKVLVEGNKTGIDPDKLPSVWDLFTDPRSSWNDPSIFPDNFNIQEYVKFDEESDFGRQLENSEPSPTSVEAVDSLMASTDGIDIN